MGSSEVATTAGHTAWATRPCAWRCFSRGLLAAAEDFAEARKPGDEMNEMKHLSAGDMKKKKKEATREGR